MSFYQSRTLKDCAFKQFQLETLQLHNAQAHVHQEGIIMQSFSNIYLCSLVLSVFNQAWSAEAVSNIKDDAYFNFNQVESKILKIEDSEVDREKYFPETLSSPLEEPFDEPLGLEMLKSAIDPMAIIDVAFKVWDIVVAGKPVVNVHYKNVAALPMISNGDWTQLTGWQNERTITYSVSAKNAYGIKTVDLEYQLKLRAGGGLNGVGKYIASARVVPSKVDVKWGYNIDVSVEVPTIINVGTKANPIAAINMDVKYKVSTILRSYSKTEFYEVHGDGMIKNNNTQNSY